jgi:hypothetical protein
MWPIAYIIGRVTARSARPDLVLGTIASMVAAVIVLALKFTFGSLKRVVAVKRSSRRGAELVAEPAGLALAAQAAVLALAVAQVVPPDPDPQVVVIPQWISEVSNAETRNVAAAERPLVVFDAHERNASIESSWAPISDEPLVDWPRLRACLC